MEGSGTVKKLKQWLWLRGPKRLWVRFYCSPDCVDSEGFHTAHLTRLSLWALS